MILSRFMEYALEGYGAVLKNGVLERVPMQVDNGDYVTLKQSQPTQQENIQTIIAFIEAVRKQHGEICSYLAMLLLVDTIQKKEMLKPERILSTYQSMLEIEKVIKHDYPYFVQLPIQKQKEYMLLMTHIKTNLAERERISKAFLFQHLFNPTTYTLNKEQ